MSKILAVIGATGIQGGSVISTILKDGTYKVRAITRNAQSEKALALIARGAEVVAADLNDEASLIQAFKGVSAIYAVTDFFEPFMAQGPEKAVEVEYIQGTNLAKAASKTPTLEHYIWSTLANVGRISGGRWNIPHFEAKNHIDDFIKADENLFKKTTFLWNTYYSSNLTFPLFTPNLLKTSGKYLWLQPTPPETKITILGNERTNVGVFVSAILRQPGLTLPGKFVEASVAKITHGDLLSTWSEVTGKKTEYVQISLEEFDVLWPAWGLEMGSMLKMWEDLGDKSWSGEDAIGSKELGIKSEELVGLKAAFAALDWSAV